MQTFLPYPDFDKTAKVLDMKRLGKQRVEAYQILNVLEGRSTGWQHHPAVKMWTGYKDALVAYLNAICNEWKRRGYKDTIQDRINSSTVIVGAYRLPPFIGNEDFHRSHQSNLLRKLPEHYSNYFVGVPNDLPYVWEVK